MWLTGVDKVLIGDARVVDVVYGARQNDRQYFEVRENVLSNTNVNLWCI